MYGKTKKITASGAFFYFVSLFQASMLSSTKFGLPRWAVAYIYLHISCCHIWQPDQQLHVKDSLLPWQRLWGQRSLTGGMHTSDVEEAGTSDHCLCPDSQSWAPQKGLVSCVYLNALLRSGPLSGVVPTTFLLILYWQWKPSVIPARTSKVWDHFYLWQAGAAVLFQSFLIYPVSCNPCVALLVHCPTICTSSFLKWRIDLEMSLHWWFSVIKSSFKAG